MGESPRDDWFSEPDASPSPGRARIPAEDEPLDSHDPRPPPRPPVELRRLVERRVLIPAAVVVAFLIAALAAAGVFSSSSPRPTMPTLTTATLPATSTTPTTTSPATAAPGTTLKPGDSGVQVKALQRALATLGYSAGAADGRYGPATKQAVASFQQPHGLTADGILGPKTLRALTRALRLGK